MIERGIIVTQSGPLRIDLVLGDTVAARNRGRLRVTAGPRSESDSSTAPQNAVLSTQEMESREYANTIAALNKSHWKIYGPGGAAEIFGIKPTTLASRVKRMGIKRPASKRGAENWATSGC
jgi:transcriptional regulator with GAF, ATPase, and Fis domain